MAQRWKHKKRGTVYIELGQAEVQTSELIAEGEKLMIYSSEDGTLWARPVKEFLDGRFEPVER